MEKIKKLRLVNADKFPFDNRRIMNKINEIIDRIENHERIMVKDRDWLLGKLEEIKEEKQ